MNTKLVMTLSAVVLGAVGIALSFLPQEVFSLFSQAIPSRLDTVTLQILGALYFAFAMTNYTAKGNLIGGIYGRPVAIGNLCHFTIAALALLKAYFSGLSTILIPALIYSAFAIAFAVIFFTHPLKNSEHP